MDPRGRRSCLIESRDYAAWDALGPASFRIATDEAAQGRT